MSDMNENRLGKLLWVSASILGLMVAACGEDPARPNALGDVDAAGDAPLSPIDGAPGSDASTGADGAARDGSTGDGVAVPDASWPLPVSCEGGSVTYGVGGEHFRTTLGAAVTTDNLSEAFDVIAPGTDEWVTTSPDGEWYLVSTERIACEGWACLAVAAADFSSFDIVRVGGEVVRADRFSTIASGGRRIIFVGDAPGGGGGDGLGLYVIDRMGAGWTSPRLITGDSPFTYNMQPAVADDGGSLLFDCTEEVYSQPPTSICEVNADGSGFHVVWTPEQGGVDAPGRADVALHSPDYLPDGSIVFEADWSGEQLWHLTGDGPPVRVAPEYGNDNSPCTLPNGCVVSLWLEREGSAGEHELKVMDPAGGSVTMLRTGVDISDTGLGCAR